VTRSKALLKETPKSDADCITSYRGKSQLTLNSTLHITAHLYFVERLQLAVYTIDRPTAPPSPRLLRMGDTKKYHPGRAPS
jgi:hypothetical protein